MKKLIYRVSSLSPICEGRRWGESWHGHLLFVRPTVRAGERDEQNLTCWNPPALGFPGTTLSPWMTQVWNEKSLLLRRKWVFRTKTKAGLEWYEIMNVVSCFHSRTWYHWNSLWRARTLCYEWAIISQGKGWDREAWIGKPIKILNMKKRKKNKTKNQKNKNKTKQTKKPPPKQKPKHMEAKALQTI